MGRLLGLTLRNVDFNLNSKRILCAILVFSSACALAKPVANKPSSNYGYLSERDFKLPSSNPANTQQRIYKPIEIVETEAPKKFKTTLAFSTSSLNAHDDNVKSNITISYVGVEFEWKVSDSVQANLIGGYVYSAGNSAIVYGYDSTPYSGMLVREASFTIAPVEQARISAGAVSTQFSPLSSTFAARSGFAGVRGEFDFDFKPFIASLNAYQIAPSGTNPANRALDDEKNPSLSILNANFGVKYSRFKTQVGYTRYGFYGLTKASAGDSRYLGNSVAGDGSNIVNYQYKFRGQEIAAASEMNFRLDDKFILSGHVTKNDSAPKLRNEGWMTKTSYEYNFSNYSIRPGLTRFRFESDLMPAVFSQRLLGFLNRDGYAGEMRVSWKKYKLDGTVMYVDSKEVEPRPTQSDRINVIVGLEVKHEI